MGSSASSSSDAHTIPQAGSHHPVLGPPVLERDIRAFMASGNEATQLVRAHAVGADGQQTQIENDTQLLAAEERFLRSSDYPKVLAKNKQRGNGEVTIENEEWDDFYGPPVRKRYFTKQPADKERREPGTVEGQPIDRFAWKAAVNGDMNVRSAPPAGTFAPYPAQPNALAGGGMYPQQQQQQPYAGAPGAAAYPLPTGTVGYPYPQQQQPGFNPNMYNPYPQQQQQQQGAYTYTYNVGGPQQQPPLVPAKSGVDYQQQQQYSHANQQQAPIMVEYSSANCTPHASTTPVRNNNGHPASDDEELQPRPVPISAAAQDASPHSFSQETNVEPHPNAPQK